MIEQHEQGGNGTRIPQDPARIFYVTRAKTEKEAQDACDKTSAKGYRLDVATAGGQSGEILWMVFSRPRRPSDDALQSVEPEPAPNYAPRPHQPVVPQPSGPR